MHRFQTTNGILQNSLRGGHYYFKTTINMKVEHKPTCKTKIPVLFLLVLTSFPLSVAFTTPRPPSRAFRVESLPRVSFGRSFPSRVLHSTEKDDVSKRQFRPLLRAISNIWFMIKIPFPSLRKFNRQSDENSGIALSLRDGLVALISYLGVGVVAYHWVFEKWSIIDALYFSCVCFSTVGYGDICPQTDGGKLFTCFFGIAGIALLGAAVATIGSKLVQEGVETAKLAEKESRKRLIQIYDKMPKLVKTLREGDKDEHPTIVEIASQTPAVSMLRRFLKPFVSLWTGLRWILSSLLVVAFSGLIMGKLEGWNFTDSIYYSLITASTIGLGDFGPSTKFGRLLAVFFIPLSVAAVGEILAAIATVIIKRRQKRLFDTQLKRGLTMEHIKAMDTNNDGQVSREEYLLYMFMEMGLVTKDEIDDLWEQFSRLDVSNSGYLDREDLLIMAKLRQEDLNI